MTNVRCLATNCMFNNSDNKNTTGDCTHEYIDITVWDDGDKIENMKCKTFEYKKKEDAIE